MERNQRARYDQSPEKSEELHNNVSFLNFHIIIIDFSSY